MRSGTGRENALKRLLVVVLPAFSLVSCGQSRAPEIRDAWARDTAGRSVNAAVFMTISTKVPDRLVAASSPVAKRSDLMTFEGTAGAMGMRYVDGIDVPARKSVSLSPTGLHVWLAGLDRPLKAGTNIPLTLRFEKAGAVTVTVAVIAPAAPRPMSGS